MTNKNVANVAAGKPPILVRVDQLEKQMDSTLESLTRIVQDHNGFTKLFDAVLSILGPEVVLEKVRALKAAEDEERISAMEERNLAQNAEIESNIETGNLVLVDAVGEVGLIEVTETSPDGTKRRPEKAWVSVASLEPKVKAAMQGLAVGQWVQLEDGTRLDVSRVVELSPAVAPQDVGAEKVTA